MLPLLAVGIAARAAAPMIGRVVGTQFAKVAARPAAAILSKQFGRNVTEQVAGRAVRIQASKTATNAVNNYAQGATYNGVMQAGRSVNEFTQGAQENPDAKQTLI